MTDATDTTDPTPSLEPKNPASAPTADGAGLPSLLDAVYEVALDPERYNELVDRWHQELTTQASALKSAPGESQTPLAEHFQRATTILERVHRDDWLAGRSPEPDTSGNSGSGVSLPELVLSRQGRVLKANLGATALLSATAGAPLESADLSEAAITTLRAMCTEVIRSDAAPSTGAPPPEPRIVRISRLHDNRPLVVLLTPTRYDGDKAITLRCAEIVWPETFGPLLASAFDLTTAECDIVQMLVVGHNTSAIAEQRGTSKETVRTQIRELLAKTGTHSQIELIRMTIGFSMMSQQAESRAEPHARQDDAHPTPLLDHLRTPRSTVHTLADGQTLEWIEYGPPKGPPILLFHDEVIGDAFVRPLQRVAPEYRWLVPVRPGFGQSTLDSAQTPNARARAHVDSLSALVDQLIPNAQSVPVIAHGNGLLFACLFAQRAPTRCGALTVIAGSLPGRDDVEGANAYAAFMAGMSTRAPAMLRFAVQAGFAMYARVGAKRFVERVYGDAAADRSVINTPRDMSDLEHGSRLTLAQGYRGFLADEQALVDDWRDTFKATRVPIRLILGDEDHQSRHQRSRVLQDSASNVDVIPLPEAGFFAAFSDPQAIVDVALAHAQALDSAQPI